MSHFSNSYTTARDRFLTSASGVNAAVQTCYIDAAKELAVDIAVVGEPGAPSLILSSGLHGVEGFFGSAVQLALLEQVANYGLKGVRYVLIHSLNPYGFKNLRRFDQSNIDLNRNFVLNDEDYKGAPEGYAQLNSFLNPGTMPSRFEFYKLNAIWHILRYGMPSLKSSIVCGQHDFPQGIFFGGSAATESKQLMEKNYDSWLGHSEHVLHIDFHSGLGPFGSYKLLLNEGTNNDQWYQQTFGANNIEPLPDLNGTAYPVKGSMGSWLQHRYQQQSYRFVGAEFGTYGAVRVLGSIRAENRAHHYAPADSHAFKVAKAELLECFCPKSPSWRNTVISHSMDIIASATNGLVQCSQSDGQSS